MITNIKTFGSYVWVSPTSLYDGSNGQSDDESFVSNCNIPKNWISLELIAKKAINHDTSLFRFKLPDNQRHLNLPVGSYILVLAPGVEKGKDGIRPYTNTCDDHCITSDINNFDCNFVDNHGTGSFVIMCKRYDEWGKPESSTTHFLFTKTNHSYKPPGVVSNYLHSLAIGDSVSFKHNHSCVGRFYLPNYNIKYITMLAVGVGVAPMIQTLRHIFSSINKSDHYYTQLQIVLLYGVREVRDILMYELLTEYEKSEGHRFKVIYCVGSRWANIHYGVKTKSDYRPPPPPVDIDKINKYEIGWINEEKIRKYAFPPSDNSSVIVCGLPGVYDKLCGPRFTSEITEGSALANIGYKQSMVYKL